MKKKDTGLTMLIYVEDKSMREMKACAMTCPCRVGLNYFCPLIPFVSIKYETSEC